VYIKTSQADIKNNILSTGVFQKYKIGNSFIYNVYFNLPSVDSAFQTYDLNNRFNVTKPPVNYTVFMGKDKTRVGELIRRGDGNHVLEFKSAEDYEEASVFLGDLMVATAKL
jgi:hypothetical protein